MEFRMSWNLSFVVESDQDPGEAFDTAYEKSKETGNTFSDETREQLDCARAVVEQIVDSGAFGNDKKRFQVTLSGHANEHHEPKKGWANDTISVYVTQLK